MLIALICAHFVLGIGAPWLTRWIGTRSFIVCALLPAGAFVWLLTLAPRILAGQVLGEDYRWIGVLGINLTFRMGLLQWVLGLIVTGIGALVLVYSRWYFTVSPTASRCLGLLVAFAGAMLGLVSADNMVVLYTFWELTTVFSFLLIGNDFTRKANRGAAITALMVTTFGGLAMLIGIVALKVQTGSWLLSDLVAHPPRGAVTTAAVLLLLVGALSKSALFPLHFWLPGAMAAATPVSAYLHAAAMVKAGVYLVAALAPAFAEVPGWRPVILVLGSITLVLGGWRALRQRDIKLLLAHGTVSQLGLIVLLVGAGTRATMLAGLGMTVAHALFKSTLFLTVGIVDKSAGTRDIEGLSGVGRQLRVLAVVAAIACASMAGIPPMLGFITKEAALESVVQLTHAGDGTNTPPGLAVLLIAAVVFGSMLTVAYSLRFWWGAFATKPDVPASTLLHKPWGMQVVPAVLGAACLVGGFLGHQLTELLEPHADTVPTGEHPHGFALWHGVTTPLLLSVLVVATGVLLFWQRGRVERLQGTFPSPRPAQERYVQVMRLIDQAGVELTSRTQAGSLIVYLFAILSVVLLGVGIPMMVNTRWPSQVTWFDNPGQIAVAVVMAVAGVLATMSRGRIRAVLLVGVTGYGTALLFLMHGAPDLALTQVLVETVTVVVFLLLLRRMPRFFTNRPLVAARWWRVLMAVGIGLVTVMLTIAAAGARVVEPISRPLGHLAKTIGHGRNVVNVILVDTRAWDTLGEVSVLVIAATGVSSLIFLRTRSSSESTRRAPRRQNTSEVAWLRGSKGLHPAARSLIFEVITRLVFRVMIVIGLWLMLRGHNAPGGGFAGGLVIGMALMVRYLAAGREELNEAAPVDAGRLLGAGLLIALVSALAPLAVGGTILQSAEITFHLGPEDLHTPLGNLGWLGEIHLVSSTLFDFGVFLIVIGVLLDYARSLGAGIDIQTKQNKAPTPEPMSTFTRERTAARPEPSGGTQ